MILQSLYVAQGAFALPLGLLVAYYFGRMVENPSWIRLKTFLIVLGFNIVWDVSSSVVFLLLLDRGMR
jgi:hypothetical protein